MLGQNYNPSSALVNMLKTEEMFVPWPYDDKGPWSKGRPVEYKGGKLKGTLTQGYGHTRSAGGRSIVLGSRWTESEASEVLAADLKRFLPDYRKLVTGLEGTQGEFDAVFSAYFNMGPTNTKKILAPWRAGNKQGTYNKFPLYVNSKGQRMQGLVRRREKEMNLWRSGVPIALSTEAGIAGDSIAPEKVDNPNKMTTGQKIAVGAGVAGAAGTGAAASHDTVTTVTDTISNVQSYTDTAAGIVYSAQSLFSVISIEWIVAAAALAGLGYIGYRIYKKWYPSSAS